MQTTTTLPLHCIPKLKTLKFKTEQNTCTQLVTMEIVRLILSTVTVKDALQSKYMQHYNTGFSFSVSSLQWIAENQNYRISTNEHF